MSDTIFAVIVYGLWSFYAVFYIWAVCFAISDLIKRARTALDIT